MQEHHRHGKVRKTRWNVIKILITSIVLIGLWLHYISNQILSASYNSPAGPFDEKKKTILRRSDWTFKKKKEIPQKLSYFVPGLASPAKTTLHQHFRNKPQKENRDLFPEISCGDPWSTARLSLFTEIHDQTSDENPIIWTVSGGSEYMKYLKLILKQWFSIGLSPVFIVALDVETAEHVCSFGYKSVVWDLPIASYSKVADAKFEVAATFSEMGAHAFFMEVDVFCQENPIPLFLHSTNSRGDEDYGIVVAGHGFADFVPNIGQYYVRPSTNATKFFRAVAKVLEYSIEHEEYITQGNVTKLFFDQRLFYQCLPPTYRGDVDRNESQAIYLKHDQSRQNNLLALCREITNSHPFPWRPVSNVYISANYPPVLFDSTICIHPLFDSPFASFELKLATARFLGFDPTPVLPESRFLKTLNGDLTFNECWNMPFIGDNNFKNDVTTHERFKNAISTLIYFAKISGRILVLPRFFRDSNVHAIMVMSLVDIRTIENHVKVQYLPSNVPYRVTVADGNLHNFTRQLQQLEDHQVVAVEYFCRFFSKHAVKSISKIKKSLKFCLNDIRLQFTKGSGSWNKLCGSDGIYDIDSEDDE